MNDALARVAKAVRLADPSRDPLRFAFALACVRRVQHLLEQPRALAAMTVLAGYVAGTAPLQELEAARDEVQRLANSHRGSDSIDGSAHAAVSATYALANALAGRALDAASYAAYASVYSYGGYAVTDRTAFEPEFEWQVRELQRLGAAASGGR